MKQTTESMKWWVLKCKIYSRSSVERECTVAAEVGRGFMGEVGLEPNPQTCRL